MNEEFQVETIEVETFCLVAIDIPAGRHDRLSRGKGSVRDARAGATEWGERQDNGRWRVPTRVKGHRWYQKSSDGFNRTVDSTVDIGPRVTVTIPAGLSNEVDPATRRSPRANALREAAKAAGHIIGNDESPVWEKV